MDILAMHQRAQEEVGDLVANVQPEQLSLPTDCTEWTVRELLAHLINGNNQWRPSGGGPFASMGLPENIDSVLGENIVDTYRSSAAQADAEWNQPGVIEMKFDTPHGQIPASERVLAHINELLMHGWDIAKATDQPPLFDNEVVEAATHYAKANMPTERTEKMPFGPVMEASDDAPAIDKLAAFMGRRVS